MKIQKNTYKKIHTKNTSILYISRVYCVPMRSALSSTPTSQTTRTSIVGETARTGTQCTRPPAKTGNRARTHDATRPTPIAVHGPTSSTPCWTAARTWIARRAFVETGTVIDGPPRGETTATQMHPWSPLPR